MIDEQKLLNAVIGICGLPPIRGAAVMRRALWEINIPPEEATIEDYLSVLPNIEKALQTYMASKVAKQRIESLKQFLQKGPETDQEAPTLESITTSFKAVSQKLKESQQLEITRKTPTRRLRVIKKDKED